MEVAGEAFLLNLSLVAIGFASVSALVMLLRQMMGGELTRFDVHLITSYISGAFAVAMSSLLPMLVGFVSSSPPVVWGVASVVAALFLALFLVAMIRRRRRVSGIAAPPVILIDWTLQWGTVALLLANAAVPPIQGVGPYAVALTLELGLVMLAFVRRVASLLAGQPRGGDWDPHKG